MTVQQGNTRNLALTADIESQKKWDKNEIDLRAHATYGQNNGVQNANSVSGYGQYNPLFSDKLFG